MKIYARSDEDFKTFLREKKIDDSNVAQSNLAYIEIACTEDMALPFYFQTDHENVLRLNFDDIDEPVKAEQIGSFHYIPLTPMDEQQGKEIVSFVLRNARKAGFLIHCAAGISRSGGVAEWIAEHFEVPYSDFKEWNQFIHPNRRIVNILRKAKGNNL